MQPSPFDLLVGLVALAVFSPGCAGELDDPARFREAASIAGAAGAGGGGGDAGQGGGGGEGPCDAPGLIFKDRCAAGCHSAASKLAGLNMESPDMVGRLRGVKGTICGDLALIDADAPGKSALYDKTAAQPSCGSSMPQGGTPLSEEERACLLEWLTAVAAP